MGTASETEGQGDVEGRGWGCGRQSNGDSKGGQLIAGKLKREEKSERDGEGEEVSGKAGDMDRLEGARGPARAGGEGQTEKEEERGTILGVQ